MIVLNWSYICICTLVEILLQLTLYLCTAGLCLVQLVCAPVADTASMALLIPQLCQEGLHCCHDHIDFHFSTFLTILVYNSLHLLAIRPTFLVNLTDHCDLHSSFTLLT